MPPLREPAGFAPDLSAGSPNRVVACAITPVRGLTPGLLVALRRLGVDFFQLRDRQASDREFERLLVRIESEAPEMLRRVVVNDRLALAASFPVAGVHLPEAGLPLPAVRSRFPRGGLLLGRSVHGVEAALTADRAGADYLILGPVAATGAKRPLPSGVLEEVCRRVEAPVWAVGGLTPGNPLSAFGNRSLGSGGDPFLRRPAGGGSFSCCPRRCLAASGGRPLPDARYTWRACLIT